MIDALNRALTAYTDCPDGQDAHTLAAARFYAVEYDDVTFAQRAIVKRLTFGRACAPLAGKSVLGLQWLRDKMFAHWPDLVPRTAHGYASLTGRTSLRCPEMAQLFPYSARSGKPLRGNDFGVDYASLERRVIAMQSAYECKLKPVGDGYHEIVEASPREWSPVVEPARVDFRVSAETLLSLGGDK